MTRACLIPLTVLALHMVLLAGAAGAQPTEAAPPGVAQALEAIEQADGSQVHRPTDFLGSLLDPSPDGVGPATAGGEPLSAYQLLAPTDGFGQAVGHQVRALFALARWVATAAEVALRWALGLHVWRLLLVPAHALATTLQHDLLGPLGLAELVLVLVAGRAAWLVFTHRHTHGLVELLTGLLLAVSGGLAVAHVDDVACAGLGVLDGVSSALSRLVVDGRTDLDTPLPACGTGDGWPAVGATAADAGAATVLGEVLPTTLVRGPHMLLQWGALPDGACVQVARAVVARGAWRDPTVPLQAMRDAGCTTAADHAARPDAERLVAGAAHLGATSLVAGAVLLLAGSVLVAQVGAVLLVMAFPAVAVLGVAPVGGRQLLVRWAGACWRLAVRYLLAAVLLVGFLALLHTIVAATAEGDVVLRLALAGTVAGAVMVVHGRAAGGWLARARPRSVPLGTGVLTR